MAPAATFQARSRRRFLRSVFTLCVELGAGFLRDITMDKSLDGPTRGRGLDLPSSLPRGSYRRTFVSLAVSHSLSRLSVDSRFEL
ncbi:Hypothetical predicted protein [Pelobates cultripes]|uniref:Uncharacterized protein n=1 Tax=Pelobates cultripes TaxID=61616 RepID=A0AAD1RW90_PELCU|nr:Hypothetical predicted protein [Pelobates cultripes]